MQGEDALVSRIMRASTPILTCCWKTLALDLASEGSKFDTWLSPSSGAKIVSRRSTSDSPITTLSNESKSSPVRPLSFLDVLSSQQSPDFDWALLAGHRALDVLYPRTLSDLYLEPLMRRFDRHNGGGGLSMNESWFLSLSRRSWCGAALDYRHGPLGFLDFFS